MYKGKRVSKSAARKSRLSRKSLVVIAALALVFVAAIGTTIAYLSTGTGEVTNTFIPGRVSCKVNESFNGSTKSNVKIENTGNTDAYIRAAIVVNWVDASGNVYGQAPGANDYSLSLGSGWTQSGGYYYWTSPVAPGAETGVLISSAAPVADAAPDGYTLQVTVLASAVQSNPTSAVQDAWGFVPGSN